ncbi:uncharacterized protein LOC127878232 isoform X3 [Dreissena polymorpha]|nr:uncharacterized protein LOC127878232 isoform X2 [Dreissena polymorpha]XP_052280713.1 uncharacterized protein LOC127878232 isoform X3 [Dreissena polymorpha]
MIDRYMRLSKEFFQRPEDFKEKFARGTALKNFFGWIAFEREKLNPSRPGDLKETFNYHIAFDPDTWPSNDYRDSSRELFLTCIRFTRRVLEVLSVGLGIPRELMTDAHRYLGEGSNPSSLRSLYYPPISEGAVLKPGQIRLGEHTDYGTITLLFQDDIGGLEVEIPGQGFVPAVPIPGTVIVNIGALMQRWTSDKLIATNHRVVVPEVEFKKRSSRQAVAFFIHPDDEYIVKCLDGFDKYEPISSMDYLRQRFDATY